MVSKLLFFQSFTFQELQNKLLSKTFQDEMLDFYASTFNKYNLSMLFDKKLLRKILSSYMIYYYKDDVTLQGDIYSEKIFELSKDFVMKFDSYENTPSFKLFNESYVSLKVYLKFFEDWKSRESLILVRPLLKSYKSFHLQIKSIIDNMSDEEKTDELSVQRISEFKKMKRDLRKKIKTIIGTERGEEYIKTGEIPVFSNEKIFSDTEKVVKKAFWDVFEENIKEKKYDSLKQILQDLKDFIFQLLPNREDMRTDFNENLNFEILFALIDEHKQLDNEYIKNIMLFFISYLEKMQAANEDKETELFKEVTLSKLSTETEDKTLRFFFENMFNKYENIQVGILNFYESSKNILNK